MGRWRVLEADLGRLRDAVLLAQVPVGLHRQGAAIGMPEPLRHGGDINARLDASGGE